MEVTLSYQVLLRKNLALSNRVVFKDLIDQVANTTGYMKEEIPMQMKDRDALKVKARKIWEHLPW